MIIYCITNLINNKKYIGQTHKPIEERFKRHCWKSEHTKNMPISLSIRKYGKEFFKIECLSVHTTQQELDTAEINAVLAYNTFCPNGYNLRAGNARGITSEITKQRISNSNKGKKASIETKKKLSISHTGYKMKQETKDKLSSLNKGKKGSELCYQRARESLQKEYDFIDPNGNKIHIINMKRFCKENLLSPSKMCEVSTGKRSSYKGWKVVQNLCVRAFGVCVLE